MGASGEIDVVTIGDHRIRLDPRSKHGRMYLKNSSAGIDDVDVAIARRFMRPGDRVLDLGANIGYNALHYLNLGAAHVDAVEPHPDLHARLRSFEGDRFTVHPVAIGAAPGRARMVVSQTHDQGHTLKPEVVAIHRQVFGATLQEIDIDVTTADLLFPSARFDYIKADIEGSELDFIAGARTLFTERPPRVLQIEIMPDFYDEYAAVLSRYFRTVLRIDYDRDSGRIEAVAPSAPARDGFRNVPPNYVLFNERVVSTVG
ncbi:FkbM family methyltransferase [Methylobacterium oryzihabitans]|uniref:FkbM family methyltransferase n=1 Tax=Methylobacterium oryzihabitans TaxID=2499852 RepID=A0A3S2VL42_9HYPH|nr:FkbM family methyltransferase [Methylobacterium oryzihabitans]RVU15343.1 FkbM family methyltransferase [Methylobacterium oryzihabitans]